MTEHDWDAILGKLAVDWSGNGHLILGFEAAMREFPQNPVAVFTSPTSLCFVFEEPLTETEVHELERIVRGFVPAEDIETAQGASSKVLFFSIYLGSTAVCPRCEEAFWVPFYEE